MGGAYHRHLVSGCQFGLKAPVHLCDTKCSIIAIVARTDRLLEAVRANPKADWTPHDVRTVARVHGPTLRQRGTSHAVLTNALGQHLTFPMHKPIKPVYIRRLVALIEAAP